MKFLILLISINSFAQITHIDDGIFRTKKIRTKSSSKNLLQINRQLQRKLDLYREIHKMGVNIPQIDDFSLFIPEGKLLQGRTDLVMKATSTKSSITISKIIGENFPPGTKISCSGVAKYKAIMANCNRLIINEIGYPIKAELRNKDGSRGIVGILYTGEEKYLTGMFLASASEGAIRVSQTKGQSIFGEYVKATGKNAIKEALAESAKTTTELLKDKFQTEEPIVFLPRNTKVLIYFTEELKL